VARTYERAGEQAQMSLINMAKREINCKIVYYGIGLCGKTTNLHFIHQKVNPQDVGDMVSIDTETERTLYCPANPQSAICWFDHVLPRFREELENIRKAAAGRRYSWEIPEDDPLLTDVSRGQYEAGERVHKEHIFAAISATWSVAPLGPHGPKYARARLFELGQLASTKVRLFRYSPDGRHQEAAEGRTSRSLH